MVVLVVVGIAAVLAVAMLPFLLPWPQQIRWLVNSVAIPDPYGMSVTPGPLTLREVTIADVDRSAEWIAVGVSETPRLGWLSWYTLPTGTATPDTEACLRDWWAARTPLLLVASDHGEASLHGPAHAVVGFGRPATGARVHRSGPGGGPVIGDQPQPGPARSDGPGDPVCAPVLSGVHPGGSWDSITALP